MVVIKLKNIKKEKEKEDLHNLLYTYTVTNPLHRVYYLKKFQVSTLIYCFIFSILLWVYLIIAIIRLKENIPRSFFSSYMTVIIFFSSSFIMFTLGLFLGSALKDFKEFKNKIHEKIKENKTKR